MSAAATSPPLARLAARLTGLAPQRPLTTFARRSIFQRLPRRLPGTGRTVLFYTGCYAAYIRPELGEAAARALNHLGMTVLLPPQQCCGLPMLSKGLPGRARTKVRSNLKAWLALLDSVDNIVVTCSSCGYALQHDWAYLLRDPGVAVVSAKTVHISQLLNTERDRLASSPRTLKLAYHQPCHLRLQAGAGSSMALLQNLPGITLEDLKSHCCGMAGSWGMLAANFDLSQTIGTPMLTRLNHSGADYAVTDCPTCQMQMEHLGRLPVRHPVEIVWQTLQAGN